MNGALADVICDMVWQCYVVSHAREQMLTHRQTGGQLYAIADFNKVGKRLADTAERELNRLEDYCALATEHGADDELLKAVTTKCLV